MRAGPAVVGGGGLGLLILVVVVALLGGDPTALLQQAQQAGPPGGGPEVDAPLTPAELEQQDFVSAILGETEDIWSGQFQDLGRTYRPPTLVLYIPPPYLLIAGTQSVHRCSAGDSPICARGPGDAFPSASLPARA